MLEREKEKDHNYYPLFTNIYIYEWANGKKSTNKFLRSG